MDKRQKDYLSSGIFLVFGAIIIILTKLTVEMGGVSVIGPRAFPYFIGSVMMILSVVLFLQTKVKYDKEKTLEDEFEKKSDSKDELRVGLVVVIAFIYVILFDKLGYFISTFISSTSIMLILKVKDLKKYAIVYAAAILIYFAFTKLLYVMLP